MSINEQFLKDIADYEGQRIAQAAEQLKTTPSPFLALYFARRNCQFKQLQQANAIFAKRFSSQIG